MKRAAKAANRQSTISVQSPTAPCCTDSPADLEGFCTVARPLAQKRAEYVQVQVFRAKMKQFVEQRNVLILGRPREPRAIVVPIPEWEGYWFHMTPEMREQMLRAFTAALDDLRD